MLRFFGTFIFTQRVVMPFCTEFEYAKHPPNRLDSMNKFKRKKTSKEIKVSNFARKERKMQVANLNCCWVQCKASMWNSNVICWNVKTKSKRNQSKVGVFQYSQAFSQGNILHAKKPAKWCPWGLGWWFCCLFALGSLWVGSSLGSEKPSARHGRTSRSQRLWWHHLSIKDWGGPKWVFL